MMRVKRVRANWTAVDSCVVGRGNFRTASPRKDRLKTVSFVQALHG